MRITIKTTTRHYEEGGGVRAVVRLEQRGEQRESRGERGASGGNSRAEQR
jgi:hypothetical protein